MVASIVEIKDIEPGIASVKSPLSPEDFEYVYGKVKADLMLASISGGTDICSCFALGNPTLPVRKGELQAFGLGLDACAFDRDSGRAMVGSKAALREEVAGMPGGAQYVQDFTWFIAGIL